MKSVNVIFEDQEFDYMKKLKGNMSWREYFLLPRIETLNSEEECMYG